MATLAAGLGLGVRQRDGLLAHTESALAAALGVGIELTPVHDMRNPHAPDTASLVTAAWAPAIDAVPAGFEAVSVLARRPDFLGDAEFDRRKPCRFVQPLISFGSEGVLSAACVVESGVVFEPALRALAEALGDENGVIVRFKAACVLAVDAKEPLRRALLFEGGPSQPSTWTELPVEVRSSDVNEMIFAFL